MLTSSLKADFCSSKARLESAILVSAMNFTSSISFLHSASWQQEGQVLRVPLTYHGPTPRPRDPWPWGQEGKPTYPDACVSLSLGHPNVGISLYHGSLCLAQGA